MFRISEAANLAIHAVAFLAANESGELVPAAAIAERLGCSPSHLAKVLNSLANRGFVSSSRGARGGYGLTVSRDGITAYDVLAAVDGELPENGCLLGQPICQGSACAFQDLFADVRELFIRRLQEVRLVDIPIRS